MMVKTSLFFFLFSFNLLSASFAQEEWVNPEINLQLRVNQKAVKQYPHSKSKRDLDRDKYPKGDVEGFMDFSNRMSDYFSESGVSKSEAELVYKIIEEKNMIRNESYGMPGPRKEEIKVINAPPVPPKTELEKLKEKVSIKKISNGVYDVFYSRTSCGIKYYYATIYISDGKITNQKTIEGWSASVPC